MTSRAVTDTGLWERIEQLSIAVIRITAEHELAKVLQEIADSARDVIGARYAAIGVLNVEGDALSQFVVSGVSDEEFARIGDLPTGKGILGVLIRKRKPLRLRRLADHPKSSGFPPNHPPMESFLGVPIVGRNGPIGNLYVTEKMGPPEFTREDEALAVMLAAHAAVAVENARLYEESEALLANLRRMQTSRDRFFAMINHELRNALTAVHGWTELWLRKAGPDAPMAAHEVAESAERAVTLLEDMLDLSRLDAERLDPRIRAADAWETLLEAVRAMEPFAERRSVQLETTGPTGAVPFRSDPSRVRQILVNLLSNAIKYSPEGTTVVTELGASDERIRYTVVDRGPGIPFAQQAAIFEAFERAGIDDERGTGLGLALSRKLAQLLGGTLIVESAPGAGSRFMLEVPKDFARR
jgi:signal transduction histidine kinase